MQDGRIHTIRSTTREQVVGRVEEMEGQTQVDGTLGRIRSMREQLAGRPTRGRVLQKVAGIRTTRR